MALPLTVEREELHHRSIEMRGYRRSDGLFDIEARLIDRKTEEMRNTLGQRTPAGAAIHHMQLRLVVNEELLVVDVAACTLSAPYAQCPEATLSLQRLKGLRIGAGWSRAVRERLAGALGCTHLTELLAPLATVVYQSLWPVRQAKATRPTLRLDSCHAYASEGPLVQQLQQMQDAERGACVPRQGLQPLPSSFL